MGSNIAKLADEFGELKLMIAEFEAREAALRAEIIATGSESILGDRFSVKVVKSNRETLSVKDCRQKLEELGVSRQWFAAHTSTAEVVSVKCAAKLADKAAA